MPVIGSKGAELDLLVRQGATFGPVTIQAKDNMGNPIDLTGATIRAQIRKTAYDTLYPGATCTCTITDAVNGYYELSIPATVTALLDADVADETAEDSTYVWDMEVQLSTGRVIALTYGKVNVFREVTKG